MTTEQARESIADEIRCTRLKIDQMRLKKRDLETSIDCYNDRLNMLENIIDKLDEDTK